MSKTWAMFGWDAQDEKHMELKWAIMVGAVFEWLSHEFFGNNGFLFSRSSSSLAA